MKTLLSIRVVVVWVELTGRTRLLLIRVISSSSWAASTVSSVASSSNTTLYFVSPSTSTSTTEDPITTTPSILEAARRSPRIRSQSPRVQRLLPVPLTVRGNKCTLSDHHNKNENGRSHLLRQTRPRPLASHPATPRGLARTAYIASVTTRAAREGCSKTMTQ